MGTSSVRALPAFGDLNAGSLNLHLNSSVNNATSGRTSGESRNPNWVVEKKDDDNTIKPYGRIGHTTAI